VAWVVTIEGVPVTRVLIAVFLLALGLPVTIARTKLLIEHQRVVRQTTLLGKRWKVGENGVLAFLLLRQLARLIFFPVAPAAAVIGLVNADVGARLMGGAAYSFILLNIVEHPLNLVTVIAFCVPVAVLGGFLILVMSWNGPLTAVAFMAGLTPFIVVAVVVAVILGVMWLWRWDQQRTAGR
jgi:hypothetical protein